MTARWGLRRRITLGLIAYAVLLSIGVAVHGFYVNENAEHLVWESLLRAEMDHFLSRRALDPDYRWPDTQTLELLTFPAGAPVPPPLDTLPPGVHDEFMLDGRERVILVRDVDGQRLVLALDIGDLERREYDLGWALLASALAVVTVMAGLVAWGVGALTRPLSALATRIARLQPQETGQRLQLPPGATAELAVIADALNDYLARNEQFVARERAFIDSASHELRTPVAVIAGAAEIAAATADLPSSVRGQLARIHGTARDVERLIGLLLVLAKDPERLAEISDRLALDQLLPVIIADHRHLCRDKDLELRLAPLPACELVAPLHIVQAAIGNLLRNAIENSDRGVITIGLTDAAVVTIDDPGHGMSPEEISAIHARLARGGHRDGGGIGLDLIARICNHLGWTLSLDSLLGRGTRATLDLGASLRH